MPELRWLPTPQRVGSAVLVGVDRSITTRWQSALTRAAEAPGASVEERVAAVIGGFVRELGTLGGVAGAAAAVPVGGTAASVATSAAEMSWVTVRLADMILTIAALHGITESSVEERRAWVVSVLAMGDQASVVMNRLAGEAGRQLGRRATAAIPTAALRRFNRAVGRTLVTKYGTKRGAIALGTALPFGIGAAVGAASNAAMVRGIGRSADRLFRSLRPSDSLTVESWPTGS